MSDKEKAGLAALFAWVGGLVIGTALVGADLTFNPDASRATMGEISFLVPLGILAAVLATGLVCHLHGTAAKTKEAGDDRS